jgi:hypothetical protein
MDKSVAIQSLFTTTALIVTYLAAIQGAGRDTFLDKHLTTSLSCTVYFGDAGGKSSPGGVLEERL